MEKGSIQRTLKKKRLVFEFEILYGLVVDLLEGDIIAIIIGRSVNFVGIILLALEELKRVKLGSENSGTGVGYLKSLCMW